MADLGANGSGQTLLVKRAAACDPYSVHLPSSATCMAPVWRLPRCPQRAHSAGDKAKAEEGKVDQAWQEVRCDRRSPLPRVPLLAAQWVRQDPRDCDLTQHQGSN